MGLGNSSEFLAVSMKRDKLFEGKLNIFWGKQELPELHSAYVNARGEKQLNHSKISRG